MNALKEILKSRDDLPQPRDNRRPRTQERRYEPDHHSTLMPRAEYYIRIAEQNRRFFRSLIETDKRVRASQTAARLYPFTHPLPPVGSHGEATLPYAPIAIRVVPGDSLDTAEYLYAEGKGDIAVLNMANSTSPGGSYLSGAGAQEEALCRRSTLYLTIGPEHNFHPIPEQGAIYSPDVLVVRRSDQEECRLLPPESRWWTNIISVAAICRPPLNAAGTDFAITKDREDMKARIRTLFRVAVIERKVNLVLSALGCGAFRNPPETVATLFKEVLQEDEFGERFEGIWFAIMDRKGSRNYNIFRETLDRLRIWGKQSTNVESPPDVWTTNP
jgi:uncharacterized protein (TIGR02452 family)